MSASLFSQEPESNVLALPVESSTGVGACLGLDVVGDVQRLNLVEELAAFGGIGGELVESFAERLQLEADAFAANPAGAKFVFIEIPSAGVAHT